MKRQGAASANAEPSDGFFGALMPPEQAAELAGVGDEGCDKRPPGLPDDMACCFRKGHTSECRFFGNVEEG